jgi:hypothetical protein
MHTVERWSQRSLVVLFVCSIFSYIPVVRMGTLSHMNVDISLLYIALLATSVLGLPLILRHTSLLLSHKAWKWLVALQLYLSLSVIWSVNPVRGSVVAGFGWLLVIAASLVVVHKKQLQAYKKQLQRLLAWMTAALCAVGLWQLIGDALHLPTLLTLLPDAYRGGVFGFARPTGFALEPQFFGSLLLIPLGYYLWRVAGKNSRNYEWWAFFGTSTLLVLTISRGALLATAICVLLGFVLLRPSSVRSTKILGLLVAASCCAFVFIGMAAAVRAGSASAVYPTLRGVAEQLSLGTLQLPAPATSAPTPPVAASPIQPTSTYAVESTNSRLRMSDTALDMWRQHPLFGVGIGGFGAAAHQYNSSLSPSSVVNNFYLELLAETGVVGAGLLAVFLATLYSLLIRRRVWLPVIILTPLLVQWCFFSGNANVVHLWLMLGIALAITATKKPHAYSAKGLVQ